MPQLRWSVLARTPVLVVPEHAVSLQGWTAEQVAEFSRWVQEEDDDILQLVRLCKISVIMRG